MTKLNQSQAEIEELREELSRRLTELRDFVRSSYRDCGRPFNSLESCLARRPVPPAIPIFNRSHRSRIVVSTSSQTDSPEPELPDTVQRLRLNQLPLSSRTEISSPVHHIPEDIASKEHHREKLATCITDIRARLARIRDPVIPCPVTPSNMERRPSLRRQSPFKI